MSLFDDIVKKADTQADVGEDKKIDQLVAKEFDRMMADFTFLNRKFAWFTLTPTQQQFYIDEVIHNLARDNVMKPILKERQRLQDEKAAIDKHTYLNKRSGDKDVILYQDKKRSQFVGPMSVKCPNCKEIMAMPTHYIGEYFWKDHLATLSGNGKGKIGLVVFLQDAPIQCEHCKYDTHISVLVVP